MKMLTFAKSVTLTVFSFVVLTGSLWAQKPTPTPGPPPPSGDDEVIKVESRLVAVPVAVTDSNGEAVQGLTEKDFRVAEEGRAQKIDKVGNADTVPLEIVLLFDVSASTDAMFRFEQETAAKFLQDVMRPMDRATIYTVGEKAVLLQSSETAERSITAIKSIIPTKQQTAFYDSVTAAARHLNNDALSGRRKVVVVISDGEDTNSAGVLQAIWNAERKIADNIQGQQLRALRVQARDSAKVAEQTKVLKALQDADAVFYSVNPAGSSYQLNQMSVFGQENMQKFADQTGGTAFLPKFLPIDTKDELMNSSNLKKNNQVLEGIFKQLANELRAQYLIQYYSESDFPNGRYVKLDVGLTNSAGRKLRARQGYFVKN